MKTGAWGVVRGAWVLVLGACASGAPVVEQPAPAPSPQPVAAEPSRPAPVKPRVAPPELAFRMGLMPAASTGVSGWRLLNASYDGRGVLIAILDSGVDPGIAGLTELPDGGAKIVDLRDFSGEGLVQGNRLRELQFGDMPQADLNGDGDNRDEFAVEVARDSIGWKARIDLDNNGSLEGERWLRDYASSRETFTFGAGGTSTGALNFDDGRLVVYVDNSGHGSHVAGIAAGYNIYGQRGFHGIAPGAQLLGLKIADNLRGAVSTTGSMVRALDYALRTARRLNLPLVVNMSFGVGNAQPGRAVMDSIIDAFLIANPDVVFTLSAGNDGPGTETTGLPASSELAAAIGSTYPASFAGVQYGADREFMGWWSARGGSTAKPEFVVPGVAYSTVPVWKTGDEISGGTSMSAPHAAGLAALLISAMRQNNREIHGAEIIQALRMSALPIAGEAYVDQGAGVPDVRRAWTWLQTLRRGGVETLRVEALPPAADRIPVAPVNIPRYAPGAYRRNGLASAVDTVQRFRVAVLRGSGGTYRLRSDAAWLRADSTVTIGAQGFAIVEVRYDAAALAAPGRYTGVVRGIPVADSTAGAAFVLANTVIVSQPDGPLQLSRQMLSGGATARYYINVPEQSSGFIVRASARDENMQATVALYEPTGRPARHDKSADIGGHRDSLRTTLVVSPDEALPGVWEVVVQAMPGPSLQYDLTVEPAPAIAEPTLTEWIGADTSFTVTLEAGATKRRFNVPEWATMMTAEVEVTPALWNELTDFSITMFDADGVRIGNGAMNYPYHRVSASLPGGRAAGYTATLDCFPAFARLTATPGAQATIRLRFEGAARAPASRPPAPAGWRHVHRERRWAGNDRTAATTKLVHVD